ncbi:MAG: hypothetical protein AAF266_12720 [Planctomycetota bacterium]
MSVTPSPLPPAELAAREWPPLRARLIDIAAALDRLDAASSAPEAATVREQAVRLLAALLAPTDKPDRAERLLEMLSREYDPAWRDRFAESMSDSDCGGA